MGFILVVVILALIISVSIWGKETVADTMTPILEMAIRFMAYFLTLILGISSIYWIVKLIKLTPMNGSIKVQLVFLIAYLLGSIPFGYIFTRLAGLGDIRRIGSGNIGATNVLRTGRKELAALTLIMDGAKGWAAVIVAMSLNPMLGPAAGLAALLGHMFPAWLGFKGGKGVATAIGVILALAWPVGISVMLLWLITAVLFRYSSLAAIVSIGVSPFLGAFVFRDGGGSLLATAIMAFLVILKHRENIKRLLDGTEPTIGSEKETNGKKKKKKE